MRRDGTSACRPNQDPEKAEFVEPLVLAKISCECNRCFRICTYLGHEADGRYKTRDAQAQFQSIIAQSHLVTRLDRPLPPAHHPKTNPCYQNGRPKLLLCPRLWHLANRDPKRDPLSLRPRCHRQTLHLPGKIPPLPQQPLPVAMLTRFKGRDGFLISTVGPPLTKVCCTSVCLQSCKLTLAGTNRRSQGIISRVRREAITHSE
jgi:hypothetical protein